MVKSSVVVLIISSALWGDAMSAPGETCSGLSWTYDILGNRKDQTVTGGACTESHLTINHLNRIGNAG